MHQVGKYSPTRFLTLDTPITVLGMVHKSSTRHDSIAKGYDGVDNGTESEEMLPPPSAMRMSKGAKVKAMRRHPSPQPTRIGSLEAVWSGERAKQSPDGRALPAVYSAAHTRCRSDPVDATRYSCELKVNGQAGGQPSRSRKRVLHPDVRTIFSPKKDPRVKEETGEGHCFGAGEAATWCDLCCGYILIDGLVCSGEVMMMMVTSYYPVGVS